MIKHLNDKPKIFSHLNGGVFYLLNDENGTYGYGALDFTYYPFCILHLEVTRFDHFVFQNLRDDWEKTKDIVRSYGGTRVIVNHPSDDKNKLWSKFVMKFGFKKPVKYLTSYQEI